MFGLGGLDEIGREERTVKFILYTSQTRAIKSRVGDGAKEYDDRLLRSATCSPPPPSGQVKRKKKEEERLKPPLFLRGNQVTLPHTIWYRQSFFPPSLLVDGG